MSALPQGIELLIDGEVVRVQGPDSCLVESKSVADEWHAVEVIRTDDGRFDHVACTCRGFEIRKACRHARAIGRWLKGSADIRFREDPTDEEA